jgi:DNA processing protein
MTRLHQSLKVTKSLRLLWGLWAATQLGVTNRTNLLFFRRLLLHQPAGIKRFWQFSPDWLGEFGLLANQQAWLQQFLQTWPLTRFKAMLQLQQIKICLLTDADYPPLLKYIPEPPPVLFYRGQLTSLAQPTLAVVGTRRVSNYGRRALNQVLSSELTGATLVSGMMYGVDALAHERALSLGLPTVAFLGYGLNLVWPASLQPLAARIVAAGGALISEYAPWSRGLAWHFPQRNRLVAGTTLATLVVEAALKSGSLITARLALEYGREVLAVPGEITQPLAAGTLALIKKGATPITTSREVLAVLVETDTGLLPPAVFTSLRTRLRSPPLAAAAVPNPIAQQLLTLLAQESLYSEDLVLRLGASAMTINQQLSILELNGFIKQSPDGRWFS